MLTWEMRAIAWLSQWMGRPVETVPVEQARAGLRRTMGGPRFVMGVPSPIPSVVEGEVAGVRIRRYRPASSPGGTVVFFHGGGFVTGDLDTHDSTCRAFCAGIGREVVAVDYRRAPEHRAPAAADDCEAVVRSLVALGQPVAVAGDSAGGNLAAVVARRMRDAGLPLAAQLLVYPVTDLAAEHASYREFASGFLLSAASMRFYRDAYEPDPARRSHPDVSPLHAPSLARLAPAYVLLAGCDVLRDEGRAYARRLAEAGVAVQLDEVPGVLHGFVSLQGLEVTRAATRRACAWLDLQLSSVAGPSAVAAPAP